MSCDRSQVVEKLKEIITARLGTRPEEITLEADIIRDLGAYDEVFAEIVVDAEEAFGIELPLVNPEGREPEGLLKVSGLVDYILSLAA
ncbi:acyl carrier protein [Candidatus Giovannonibacteria bacterium]|nr:acyl carrier protein [Candidatus Giovannonibacteria bacterium]